MTPEFTRPLLAAQIGANPVLREITATPAECAAIALRLGLPALARFHATFRLLRQRGDCFLAEGQLNAEATRDCVVSLEAFTETTTFAFTIRFVPEVEAGGVDGAEMPIDYDDGPDVVDYAQGAIDLGEAAVVEYALALAPYPRKPGVTFAESVDEAANPFAALQARKPAG